MDATGFTAFCRSFSSAASRRGWFSGLARGVLVACPLVFGVDEVAAKRKRKRKKNRRKNPPSPSPPPSPPPPGPVTRVTATCPGPAPSVLGLSDGNGRLAQKFTALATGPLVSADLLIGKNVDTVGEYILRLSPLNGSGFPTDDILAETAVSNLKVPAGPSTVTFNFSSPFSVVIGDQYALVLTRPGSDDLGWFVLTGDPCPGQCFFNFLPTGPFTACAAGGDLIFTAFVLA